MNLTESEIERVVAIKWVSRSCVS